MLAQSDMALKMGDVKKGLAMLKKIQPDNVNFIEAKKKQAQLYLDELKDRMNYQRCYLEILDHFPSTENFRLTAQALMDIQEPDEAIQYFEKALDKDPDDMKLIRETGKALVMTHDYNRAIKFYEQTLQDDPRLYDLRADLAELYLKLKAFEDSKRTLIEALKSLNEGNLDFEYKSRNVHTLINLARIYLEEDMMGTDWKFKENPDAKQALIEASRKQLEVIELCKELSHDDRIDDERATAADISYKLGKYYEDRDGNLSDAILCYNDCLSKQNQHKDAMVAIARINQAQG